MSNLIPEQRVDKNGVTVTRHVRASKNATSGKDIPKPKLANAKYSGLKITPTKQQARQHFYLFDAKKHPVDSELLTALGIVPHARKGIHASEFQVYDVLSVTDRGTAIALLEAGVSSSTEAKKILTTLGKRSLLQDNSEVAAEALKRNILSFRYIEQGTGTESEGEHFLDYLEASNIMSLSQYPDMHNSVRNGSIRLEDVKTLTPARITMADNWITIKKALTKLAEGTANYTVNEVNDILDRYPTVGSTLRQAFEMADHYGAAFAVEMPPTESTVSFSYYLLDHEFEVERSKSLLRYNQKVVSNLSGFGSGRRKPSHEDIIVFHDAGANPDHVANGSITITQIDAITNNGIAPSVSGGWL
jgi:hypothetical protein